MKHILGILLLISLASLASAQLPSDLIAHQEAPKSLDLRSVAPSSAKAIDATNPDLTTWRPMPQFVLGMRNSEDASVVQSLYEGVPSNLVNFSQSVEPLPPSVEVENVTGKVSEFPDEFSNPIYL